MPTLVIFAVAGEEGNFRSSPANHGEYDEESYVFCTLLFNKSFWFANKSFFSLMSAQGPLEYTRRRNSTTDNNWVSLKLSRLL
jgi:hypothetical protein